jgi:hypothetical protein
MNKSAHLVWGAIFYIIAYIIFSEIIFIDGPTIFISLLITLIYSLLPDLDLNSSWIKNQFNRIAAYFIILLLVLFLFTGVFDIFVIITILIGVELLLLFIKHRTIMHSPIFGALLSAPLLFINFPNYLYFGAAIIGYFSHLIVDGFKK